MTADHEGAVVVDGSDALVVPAPRAARSTRDRILDAAVELTSEHGWAGVTMARLAGMAGVSRQTVYNEVGRRPDLAEAMILRELDRFLGAVREAFERNDELLVAVEEATRRVLERARDNRLLHAIVSATHGADTELLPYLTGHSAGLLGVASELIRSYVARFDTTLDAAQSEVAIDTVVRLVLSQVMQPSGEPGRTAAELAWVTGRILQLR